MAYSLIANTAKGSVLGAAVTTNAINTTGAQLLLVGVGYYYPSGNPAIGDSKSNTWFPLGAQAAGASGEGVQTFYAVNPIVGSGHTFTNSTANFSSVAVSAWGAVTPVHDQESGNNVVLATSVAAGSVTPSENDELVLAVLCVRDLGSTGDTVSINGGFTISDQIPGLGANRLSVGMAYLVQTTAAAANPTWSWTNSDSASAVIETFTLGTAATGNPWYAYRQMNA